MYASDYGFAAAPSAWTTTLGGYGKVAIKSANWMYLGSDEWTISRRGGFSLYAFSVNESGSVTGSYNYVTNAHAVLPVFNLVSSVTYVSGDGTKTEPIHIN